MNGLIAQCQAELLRTVRQRRFIFMTIAMPVIFYFVFTSTVSGNQKIDGTEWKNYYLISMTTFSVIGAALNSLGIRFAQERHQGWTHLLRLTPLPSSAYIVSKILAQSLLNSGIIIVIFMVAALFKGVHMTLSHWILSGLWILIGALPFIAIGIFIGLLKSIEVTQVVANILHLALAMLGGLWMPLAILPHAIQTIAKWLPSYRVADVAWNMIGNHSLIWSDLSVLALYLIVFMVLSIYIIKRQEAV